MAALGSVNFGWNIGVINIPGDVISNCVTGPSHYNGPFPSCIQTESTIWGVAVALADKHGRKFVLTWAPLLSVCGALLLSLSTTLAQFIIGRIFVGIAAGLCNGTVSVSRDILSGTIQLATGIGIMLANPCLWGCRGRRCGAFYLLSPGDWRPDNSSPKWLVAHGRTDQAHSALARLRKNADITLELQDMIADAARQATQAEKAPKANVLDVLMGRTPDNLRHQLVVVSTVMLFQQMSGINAIFNRTTHDDPSQIPTTAQILSLVISIVAAISVFAGMLLCARFGRRTLMLLSHGTMALFSLLMVVGSITGTNALVITMMTPAYAMTAMAAIGGAVNYAFTFAIGVFFPPMQEALGDYTFFFFMGFNILAFVFCFFFLPETKGYRVEDVVAVHTIGLHCVLGSRYTIRTREQSGGYLLNVLLTIRNR
ncbi:general substrate transporter [Linderina pennispora]|uniref:General substrate transporter n=1 Tax=Linderina pennispora TaxID=61395 RepID=A0A1Y1VU47_9FUNG|nr:general substrate transporter [Linderina pennispora]ORX64274.1 general substrate transporter [Linderina pennispora]